MASWFRRVEQGILQQIGATSSSYEKDALYAKDEERLEKIDNNARNLSMQLSNYLASLRKQADTAIEFTKAMEKATSISSTPQIMDFQTIVRTQMGYKTSVVASIEKHLGTNQLRFGTILRNINNLRTEFASRKEKVLDNDSYARRVQAAEAAVTTARDSVSIAEARDTLRKLQGKAKDMTAIVTQASERIRNNLTALEAEILSASLELSLAFIAAQAIAYQHGSDIAYGLLPQYTGTALHLTELHDLIGNAAIANTASEAGGDGGRGASNGNSLTNLANTFTDATRLPITIVSGSAFTELHSTILPNTVKSTLTNGSKNPTTNKPFNSTERIETVGVVRPPTANAAPLKKAVVDEDITNGVFPPTTGIDNDGDDSEGEDTTVSGTTKGGTTFGFDDTLTTNPNIATVVKPVTTTTATTTVSIPSSTVPTPAIELVIATFDFDPESTDELRLRINGPAIKILSKTDDGWWKGKDMVTGKEGVFPFNRVRLLTPVEVTKYMSTNNPASKTVLPPTVPTTNAPKAATTVTTNSSLSNGNVANTNARRPSGTTNTPVATPTANNRRPSGSTTATTTFSDPFGSPSIVHAAFGTGNNNKNTVAPVTVDPVFDFGAPAPVNGKASTQPSSTAASSSTSNKSDPAFDSFGNMDGFSFDAFGNSNSTSGKNGGTDPAFDVFGGGGWK